MRDRKKKGMAILLILAIIMTSIPAYAASKPGLNKTKVSLETSGRKKTYQLVIKNLPKKAIVSFQSANKKVATVSRKGLIKAVKPGSTMVTAMIKAEKKSYKLTCKVTVKKSEKITEVTVSGQSELDRALLNKDIRKITIKTKAETALRIGRGDYRNIALVVKAPKADIYNNGRFESITIHEIKADTWHEEARGNSLIMLADSGRILVSEEAELAAIAIEKKEARVVVEVLGKVKEISLKEPCALSLTGKKDTSPSEVRLLVEEKAENSKITTELPVKAQLSARVELHLKQGAEGSYVETSRRDIPLIVKNDTRDAVEIRTPEGMTKVENEPSPSYGQIVIPVKPEEPKKEEQPAKPEEPKKEEQPAKPEEPKKEVELKRAPLYGAYYRTWKDVASTGYDENETERKPENLKSHGGLNKMSDIPDSVDLAFVFADWTADESDFWRVLKEEYVPALHKKGVKVIRTIGIKDVYGVRGLSKELEYEKNEEGYKKLAGAIVDGYVNAYGLDGLDIDLEGMDLPDSTWNGLTKNYSEEQKEQCYEQLISVIKEIGKLIGPGSEHPEKLFILDTTIPAPKSRVFQKTYEEYNYVLVQMYGVTSENGTWEVDEAGFKDGTRDSMWNGFKEYIKPEQFMIGFSFYEEGGDAGDNIWGDTVSKDGKNPGTPTDSRACRHAVWQPEDGVKAGIFAYAVDRDGVKEGVGAESAKKNNCTIKDTDSRKRDSKWGDNTPQVKTEYEWSIALKKQMVEHEDYARITAEDFPDEALRNCVIRQIGDYKGNIARFSGELVIDDPNIESLQGLENFANLKKLTIKGLTKLKEITTAVLPASIRGVQGSPYEKEEIRLELAELPALNTLELKNLDLEHLPFADTESFKALKTLDISENRIDFSNGTEDAKKLQKLKATAGEIVFDKQKPRAYMVNGEKKFKLTVSTASAITVDNFSMGAYTSGGTYIQRGEAGFQAFRESKLDGIAFVDETYSYQEFAKAYFFKELKEGKEVENTAIARYSFRTVNHTGTDVDNQISLAEDESYTVQVLEKVKRKGTEVYDDKECFRFEVIVGEGKERLENLTQNKAGIIHSSFSGGMYSYDFNQKKATIFDGVKEPKQGEALRLGGSEAYIIFDLGEGSAVAKQWIFYNAYKNVYGNTARETVDGELWYYTGEGKPSELSWNNDTKKYEFGAGWVKADSFDNLGEANAYSSKLENIEARYWCFNITKVKAGIVAIPELEILGQFKD
ncbi:MAG: EndoS/ChiA family endoglycosidase [Acetivibrio ethanolgignens]